MPPPGSSVQARVDGGDGSAAGSELTIGAAPDNDLVLEDGTVSRYHLEVRRTDDGILVRDLGSLNGTFDGATRLVEAIVAPETRLLLGEAAVVLSDGPAPASVEEERPEVPGLVFESAAMWAVASLARKLAPTDVSILFQGETGTGKEVLASGVHALSTRHAKPFEVVDCGAVPGSLLASHLFGHERGAFTGAHSRHLGAFERANKGTLFLDEIGELPLELQATLLGALERGRFRRVGGAAEVEVDVRVLAATHRDLRLAVNDGKFRADLYYRIAAARIEIPPLRERPDDIDVLLQHFVLEITGSRQVPFGPLAIEAMREHYWAGNVRELRNAVETALALGAVQLDGPAGREVVPLDGTTSYKDARAEVLRRFEKRFFTELLERCGGNASKAARAAQMDRPYMLSILKRHGLR